MTIFPHVELREGSLKWDIPDEQRNRARSLRSSSISSVLSIHSSQLFGSDDPGPTGKALELQPVQARATTGAMDSSGGFLESSRLLEQQTLCLRLGMAIETMGMAMASLAQGC